MLIILLNIFNISHVYAADLRLENLDINVFINEDGSARIREERRLEINRGTENYLVIGSLGESTVKDFVVSEGDITYEYVEDWDIDDSREEKAFKNGIIDTGGGYELAWGIGDYGLHDYVLEYTMTDFIKELEDSQILFWRFVDTTTNTPPENVTVTVESENPFTQGSERIYAFGYSGEINFIDGKIVATNNTPLGGDDYLTILIGFPQGAFDTSAYIDETFEEIQDKAFVGSDYGKEENADPGNNSGNGFSPFGIISSIFRNLFPIIIAIFVGMNFFNKKNTNKAPGKFKRKFKEEYYRDYPYEGNFLDVYHILYRMGVGDFENLLTSFILKWINEEKLETETEEIGVVFKKEQTNLKILNRDMERNTLEGQLFFMMLDAAGANNVLEEKEFTKWASRNRNSIENWEEKVKETSALKLQDAGYLIMEEKKILFFKTHNLILTPKGEELEENIYKYINYLYDFSLLNENEAVNVKIWDNIMVWAALLGLTEVVRKQFTKLYPRYEVETVYRGNSIYLAHALTRNVARAAAPPSSSTRSGGGGGFSSGGGGGGSFGGGGGGVR